MEVTPGWWEIWGSHDRGDLRVNHLGCRDVHALEVVQVSFHLSPLSHPLVLLVSCCRRSSSQLWRVFASPFFPSFLFQLLELLYMEICREERSNFNENMIYYAFTQFCDRITDALRSCATFVNSWIRFETSFLWLEASHDVDSAISHQ